MSRNLLSEISLILFHYISWFFVEKATYTVCFFQFLETFFLTFVCRFPQFLVIFINHHQTKIPFSKLPTAYFKLPTLKIRWFIQKNFSLYTQKRNSWISFFWFMEKIDVFRDSLFFRKVFIYDIIINWNTLYMVVETYLTIEIKKCFWHVQWQHKLHV